MFFYIYIIIYIYIYTYIYIYIYICACVCVCVVFSFVRYIHNPGIRYPPIPGSPLCRCLILGPWVQIQGYNSNCQRHDCIGNELPAHSLCSWGTWCSTCAVDLMLQHLLSSERRKIHHVHIIFLGNHVLSVSIQIYWMVLGWNIF